jgi:murein DD-endopeptidase MepM/ murein hydrolase activator NlpD
MRAAVSITSIRTTLVFVCLLSLSCTSPQPTGSPVRRDIPLPLDAQSVDAKVPVNATLETLMVKHGLPAETIASLVGAMSGVFNPRGLRANQDYRVTHTLDGILREFRYQIDPDRLLRVFRPSNAEPFQAEVVTLPKELVLDAVTLEIEKGGSLVGALEAHGENVQLALELASIYGGEVDFNSDLQPGDRLEVVFERATRHGEFVGYGAVKAAMLENAGRRLHAVAFLNSDGRLDYYDEDGRSLKRQFLKSPLPFDPRITSRFSKRRFHPVHGIYRPHLGVDFGAPAGTLVKAASSGVVDFVGTNGEAGRMVRIRHSGGYQTAYLHLSAYAPGLHVGSRVAQGDPIGRVGSSGTATGPHLDYRIIKNGTYVDPIAELRKMPKGEPIAADRLAAFSVERDRVFEQMRALLAAAPSRQPTPSGTK